MHKNDLFFPVEETSREGQKRQKATRFSTFVSFYVNVFLSSIQIVGGVFANSQALIADGIHTLSDTLGDIVVLWANHHSGKKADENHPYGHYRFENGATLILGVILLLAGVFLTLRGVQNIVNGSVITSPSFVALFLAFFTLVCKELLFHYLIHVGKKLKSSVMIANAWHARSDAASSLIVLVGISAAYYGYPIIDTIAAVGIGLLITKIGAIFAWKSLNDLMDKGTNAQELAQITNTLLQTKGILGVHDLRTRKMGDMLIADVHLEVYGHITVEEGHEIAVEARKRVLQHHQVLDLFTHLDPWEKKDLDHS